MSCSLRHSLEDFVAQRLPDEQARAFEAHLPACASCREETARIHALRGMVKGLQPFEPSATDWQKLDRAVLAAMDEAVTQGEQSWFSRWLPAFTLAAAAAAVLVLTFALRTGPTPQISAPVAKAPGLTVPKPVAVPAPIGALAVASGPDVRLERYGDKRLLNAPTLDEGDKLDVGSTALLLQTGPATGVRVAAGSRLELERLAPGHTAIHLAKGELAAEVKPLAPGATFAIRTSDLTVSVRGTAFRVVRLAKQTLVEVTHGLVAVERAGESAVLVSGPGSLVVADGAPLTSSAVQRTVGAATEAAFPLGLPDLALEALLQGSRLTYLQSDPAGAEVRVDGMLRGTTPLGLLVAPGPHTAELRSEGREPLLAQLGEQLEPKLSFSLLGPVALPPVAPVAPAVASAAISPKKPFPQMEKKADVWVRVPASDPRATARRDQMAEQVRLHPAVLQECFEFSLKHNPEMPSSLTLVVTLDRTGAVREIKTVEPYGKDFLECARPSILRWELPGAGEMEEFEMPLRLEAR